MPFRWFCHDAALVMTKNHNRSTILERSVMHDWGGGLETFYESSTLTLGSTVYCQHGGLINSSMHHQK